MLNSSEHLSHTIKQKQDGGTIQSTELKGHVLVLSFWATWCKPCWGELQQVEKVHEHFSTDPDVVIYAVAVADDQPEAIRAFANHNKLSLSMARDTADAASRLGIETYPRLFVIDSAGNIRMDFRGGGDPADDLQTRLISEIADLAKT